MMSLGKTRTIAIMAGLILVTAAPCLPSRQECHAFCFKRAGLTYQISPRLLEAIAKVENADKLPVAESPREAMAVRL